MEWLSEIFIEQSHIQAILILSIICAAGLALGKLKIGGVSLGISFVFFAGILAGHFGLKINSDMLLLAQNFGLIIFIYSLGIQVGPGFFSSFKKGGIKLNVLSLALAVRKGDFLHTRYLVRVTDVLIHHRKPPLPRRKCGGIFRIAHGRWHGGPHRGCIPYDLR